MGAFSNALECIMHPLEELEFSSRVAKRAQYEALEFTVTNEGVRVRNGSHANPENHEYLVRVVDGLPVQCACPADHNYEGACKHRVAVAIRRPVLEAARQAEKPLASDGGKIPSKACNNEQSGEAGNGEPEDCPDCIDEFPCWDCYRVGRQTLPE